MLNKKIQIPIKTDLLIVTIIGEFIDLLGIMLKIREATMMVREKEQAAQTADLLLIMAAQWAIFHSSHQTI